MLLSDGLYVCVIPKFHFSLMRENVIIFFVNVFSFPSFSGTAKSVYVFNFCS